MNQLDEERNKIVIQKLQKEDDPLHPSDVNYHELENANRRANGPQAKHVDIKYVCCWNDNTYNVCILYLQESEQII